MYFIDFLSESRRDKFFEKESNKTNFGGFLSLLYFIITILITTFYILDYTLNDKYEIQSLSLFNFLSLEEIMKINENPELNPELDFYFELLDSNNEHLSERFQLYENSTGQLLQKIDNYYHVKTKVSDLELFIVYYCDFDECLINNEDSSSAYLDLLMYYKGFKLTHQDDDCPLKELKDSYFSINFPFSFNFPTLQILNWHNIIYKEQKDISTFFSNKKEYTGGYIESYKTILLDKNSKIILGNDTKSILTKIDLLNNHLRQVEYKRTKRGKLDIVATIGALITIIKSLFIKLYEHFSVNYNNYKVIEQILFKKKKGNLNEGNIPLKEIDLDSINILKDIPLEENSDENENIGNCQLNNNAPFNNENKKGNNLVITNSNSKNISLIENINDSKDYLDSNYFCFFFKYLFCQHNEKYKKKKQFINLCNEILLKYMSIDSILYNQIILENLLKDYNWNFPYLNRIDNNELINKLKNI